jgi:hypothetical protein
MSSDLTFSFLQCYLLAYNSSTEFGCDISIYAYYVPWFDSSPALFYLFQSLLLKVASTDFNVLYSQMYSKYLYHIHPPLPSSFTFSSHSYPPINMNCFTFLSFIVLVSVHCLVDFCLYNLHVNILYFKQSNPLHYASLPFSSYPVLFNSSKCISLCLIPAHLRCNSILFTPNHSLFSFPSSLVSSNSPTFILCYIYIYICICIW